MEIKIVKFLIIVSMVCTSALHGSKPKQSAMQKINQALTLLQSARSDINQLAEENENLKKSLKFSLVPELSEAEQAILTGSAGGIYNKIREVANNAQISSVNMMKPDLSVAQIRAQQELALHDLEKGSKFYSELLKKEPIRKKINDEARRAFSTAASDVLISFKKTSASNDFINAVNAIIAKL